MNHRSSFGSVALATVVLSTALAAQGADDCAKAQTISGTGTFKYNTLKASTDGYKESVEVKPGLRQIFNDVWFKWQAPTTGVYRITTCLPQNRSSAVVMAAYEFGCPTGQGRAMVGRGMNCGAYAEFDIGTAAGHTYLIRIGHTVTQNRGWGDFVVRKVSPPKVLASVVNPSNGRTYRLLDKSSWSVAQASARLLGGHLVTVNDKAENEWLRKTFLKWGGRNVSLWLGYSDRETEGKWLWNSGELSTYTNWQKGEPSNGNSYEHCALMAYDLQGGAWRDLHGSPNVAFFYKENHGVVEVNDGMLKGAPAQVSVTTGGKQTLRLDAGSAGAAAPYLLVGTLSGTSPGTTVGTLNIPINVDAYTLHTIASPNAAPLTNSMGTLDGSGRATATLTVPAIPSLAGVTLHHAFVTFNSSRTAFVAASNSIAAWLVK